MYRASTLEFAAHSANNYISLLQDAFMSKILRNRAANTSAKNTRQGPNSAFQLPDREHDACGVGFIARLDAQPSHSLVDDALSALGRMAHRGGAVNGLESTDGAGMLIPLPRSLMRRVWQPLCGELPEQYGIGHFFLPADAVLRKECEAIIEQSLAVYGLHAKAWRDTPVRPALLQGHARESMPCIRQLLVCAHNQAEPLPAEAFERQLYVARRHMEQAIRARGDSPDAFSVASFSSHSVIYKAMVAGGQLAAFYPDLAATDCAVHYAIFHERYSTNTRPAWRLVQPFHCLAHNGEINTLACNQSAMQVREPLLHSPLFGESMRHIRPVLDPNGSDSAMLGNALELLLHGGRSLPHAAMMLVPEPFGPAFVMGEDKRAFYEYHAALMEPWDGPSALVFTDGARQIGAMLDRNALRPCRYVLTTDGLFLLASEAGVLDIAAERVARRGRLQPRRMLLVDFARHRLVTDAECKGRVISAKPYRHWVREQGIALRDMPLPPNTSGAQQNLSPQELLQQQHLYGFSQEEVLGMLVPMGTYAQEPVASMGQDTPLAVLSHKPQLLFSYMKQRFAQVTNPPIDPLREGLVMTLTGFAGKRGNLLEEKAEHYGLLRLANPVLFPEDVLRLENSRHPRVRMARIPMLFVAEGQRGPEALGQRLQQGLDDLCAAADAALDAPGQEISLLLLSDAGASAAQAPIPSLLAVSALHQHLIKSGRRHACGLLVDTGEAREPIHLAQLIAFGASGIYPRVAFATVEALAAQGQLGGNDTAHKARTAYATALQKGLLKTFSRMGIATLRSFMGGQEFEAIGLGKGLIEQYFTGLSSCIGGIGLAEIAVDALARHRAAFPLQNPAQAEQGACALLPELKDKGLYHHKKNGEKHLWSPEAIRALHKAVRNNDPGQYRLYASTSDEQSANPVTLRGLLGFAASTPVPLEEVEPESAILQRFLGAAMSLGSISPEAHEAIAIALNRTGGRSNCGEGGEAAERLLALPDGGSARSRVRQIASGRFGVTATYLVNADEIQIKMAQGAKPGEGGQLPAHKVLPEIARLRYTIPGVTLISPPPHHDIYSIEDLAQLVYDIKRLHPTVRVSVKLVAGPNVGTVATGVVKAGADSILVSGHDGGTGAAPRTAISSVGLPWELGLAQVQAALVHSGLRSRVRLQVDGQLRTGKDLAVAALLGADEFGFGASLLVALGCCMLRVCHLGTCAVGIATQDPKLRARFNGSPEHVENFLRFLAKDLRQHMAQLGMRTLEAMTGRGDLLQALPLPSGGTQGTTEGDERAAAWRAKLATLDLSHLCRQMRPQMCPHESGKGVTDQPAVLDALPADSPLDRAMLRAVMSGVRAARPARFEHAVSNTDRAACVRLSGEVARMYGEAGLPAGMIDILLHGSAGQSAGAFLTHGLSLTIQGEANDYVGKGLSGGIIAVKPSDFATATVRPGQFLGGEQAIIGNVALYGATSGELYVAGAAGERFAVRNSGALAVVEGVGDHACEYMTGGVVVVLGSTGYNFAAGMSGGTAFVFDSSELFQTRCNMDGVDIESVWEARDVQLLRSLLDRHVRHTKSVFAASILNDWDTLLPLFQKVTPIEYRHALNRMQQGENPQAERIAATEEVYHP